VACSLDHNHVELPATDGLSQGLQGLRAGLGGDGPWSLSTPRLQGVALRGLAGGPQLIVELMAAINACQLLQAGTDPPHPRESPGKEL
jgi:hypothetical protein